ncbi:MAG: citrate/2-methylcitrate synthase [Acidobacteriota bacterium]
MNSIVEAPAPHISTTATPEPALHPGLEGIVLAETRLSHVDGEQGQLLLAGRPVEEVAGRWPFEQTVFLLWTGREASDAELAALCHELRMRRALPAATRELLSQARARRLAPMEALRLGVDSLELLEHPPVDAPLLADLAAVDLPLPAARAELGRELGVLARLPGLIAATMAKEGQDESAIDPSTIDASTFAGHLLACLGLAGGSSEGPRAARVRALDTYLSTVIDHGCNASTFAARVVTSTGAGLVPSLVAALGALAGPLHGGAPGPALDLVREVGRAEDAEPVLRRHLDAGERLMGFGHRVYKVRDPRAAVLGAAVEELVAAGAGDGALLKLTREVERVATRLLDERKPGRRLRANVELYTALLLDGVGLSTELFTPVFAVARSAGWIAHRREQRAEGRLIRPRLRWRGEPSAIFSVKR